jgi:hypothetical protein
MKMLLIWDLFLFGCLLTYDTGRVKGGKNVVAFDITTKLQIIGVVQRLSLQSYKSQLAGRTLQGGYLLIYYKSQLAGNPYLQGVYVSNP